MTVVLALCADAVFGGGVALQQRVAINVPREHTLRPGLLVRLVRQPAWLVGLGAEIGGFALHAAALSRGSLVLVQPLLTLDLVFTLAIGAALTHTRLARRDWLGLACTVAGVSALLVAAAPGADTNGSADMPSWLLCATWVTAASLVAAMWALRSAGNRRAALLAVSAGVANGFMAVLTKAFADRLSAGVVTTLQSWQPYALAGAGLVALLVTQSAYQASRPTIVLPIINVVDPMVSVLIGISLFGESVDLAGARGGIVALAAALTVVGLVALGRNPLTSSEPVAAIEVAT